MNAQERLFRQRLALLARSLKITLSSEKKFWTSFRKARTYAFELEFLAKFYQCNALIAPIKALEDHFGAVDEIDAMIPFCQKYELHPFTEEFERQRQLALKDSQRWLRRHGWKDGRALEKIAEQLNKTAWLDEAEELTYAHAAFKEACLHLQKNIDKGKYDPSHKSGYRPKEVETRVHKLRREVRKIAQFMSYTDGLFALTERGALPVYKPLLKSTVAQSPFARLPATRVRRPLLVPRAQYLAITRIVDELGRAKDWAYNLERLKEAGAKGEIDFDQLDVTLRNWRGRPTPFNALTMGILREIRETRLFKEVVREEV